jgi:hypothetical protein
VGSITSGQQNDIFDSSIDGNPDQTIRLQYQVSVLMNEVAELKAQVSYLMELVSKKKSDEQLQVCART